MLVPWSKSQAVTPLLLSRASVTAVSCVCFLQGRQSAIPYNSLLCRSVEPQGERERKEQGKGKLSIQTSSEVHLSQEISGGGGKHARETRKRNGKKGFSTMIESRDGRIEAFLEVNSWDMSVRAVAFWDLKFEQKKCQVWTQ